MKTALLLDVNNTLTLFREPLTKDMADILGRLTVPFYIASGSSPDLLLPIFFKPLETFGFNGRIKAFLCGGGTTYIYDYSCNPMQITWVSRFSIRNYLGKDNYNYLMKELINFSKEYKLPKTIKTTGKVIDDRGSLINFCPIGRDIYDDEEAKTNRNIFMDFDSRMNYRYNTLEFLRRRLKNLIEEKDLRIVLGGRTSFDIFIKGQDKTRPVMVLLWKEYDRVISIGDDFFEDGNDEIISSMVMDWPNGEECPIETYSTKSPQDTIVLLHKLGLIMKAAEKND